MLYFGRYKIKSGAWREWLEYRNYDAAVETCNFFAKGRKIEVVSFENYREFKKKMKIKENEE